jgi:hypothetical protein
MEGETVKNSDAYERAKTYIPERLVGEADVIVQPFPLAENCRNA